MGAVLRFTSRPPRPPGGGGFDPPTVAVLRAEIEAGVQSALDVADRFIDLLNRMDGDPDLEEGGDAEPDLGAPEGHACQVVWFRGTTRDFEIDRQPERDVSEEVAAETGLPVSGPDRRGGSVA